MALKTPNSIHIFSIKTHSSPSRTSMKLKTLFQTFIFSHMYRISRAFDKAKSLLQSLAKDSNFTHLVEFSRLKRKNKNPNQKKLFFGSFRLHYNWCSSHVMPLGHEGHVYYDSCWNSMIQTTSFDYHDDDDELSRYLEWLEEENKGNNNINNDKEINEIDKLADLFIANCHEKFRLEKQESYRRFQEMMARSV
ncbi:hypothetical protein DH2020_048753 [Rehmannia glutinosa]|uniref:Cotton fiber protein n=1 Tax=Rehmannia glutinosa TaxID=99300 RepID=A0ABR0U4U0_REHGL